MKRLVLAVAVIAALIPGVVIASDITGAEYQATISTSNNGTAATLASSNITGLNSPALIAAGIVNFGVTDVALQYGGSDIPVQPGYDTNPWIGFFSSVPADSTISSTLYLGGVTGGDIVYIPPSNGYISVNDDNPHLELGSNFKIEIYGYWDTTQTGTYLIDKASAIFSDVYSAGNIRFSASSSFTVAGAMTSGLHLVECYADGTDAYLDVDSINLDSYTLAGGVANNANAWNFVGKSGSNSACKYLEYVKVYIGGVLKLHLSWNYGATFTDLSGYGHTGTPQFRTTSSDADVTSTLTSFSPLTEAEASGSAVSSWPTMFDDVPDEPDTAYSENATPGIFGSGLINDLETGGNFSGFASFFWFNFCFATILIGGMLAFRAHQSLMLKTIVMAVIMLAWAMPGPNVYGVFVFLYFVLFAFGINVLGKSYGW